MKLLDFLVPTYVQMLRALSAWLDKAERQLDDRAEGLLSARLASDMFPLSTQIRFACVQAQEGVFRLRELPFPPSVEVLLNEGRDAAEHPGSIADARARIEETVALVEAAASNAPDVDPAYPIAHALPMGMVFDLTADSVTFFGDGTEAVTWQPDAANQRKGDLTYNYAFVDRTIHYTGVPAVLGAASLELRTPAGADSFVPRSSGTTPLSQAPRDAIVCLPGLGYGQGVSLADVGRRLAVAFDNASPSRLSFRTEPEHTRRPRTPVARRSSIAANAGRSPRSSPANATDRAPVCSTSRRRAPPLSTPGGRSSSTSRPGSRYGSGLRRTALTTLKIAVVAPMPRASVIRAVAVKAGALRSERTASAKSAKGGASGHLDAESVPDPA